jgi:hypothetical protein
VNADLVNKKEREGKKKKNGPCATFTRRGGNPVWWHDSDRSKQRRERSEFCISNPIRGVLDKELETKIPCTRNVQNGRINQRLEKAQKRMLAWYVEIRISDPWRFCILSRLKYQPQNFPPNQTLILSFVFNACGGKKEK